MTAENLLKTYLEYYSGSEGGEREGRERGEEGERGGRKGEGEGRSLPYQSKNRSRVPDCLCIAAVHRRCHRTTLLFVTLFQTRYCSADKCTSNGPRQERSRVPGTKVRSRERKFHGTNGPGNECSKERMVPRTKVPSWERMFQGTNSLGNEYSWYQSRRRGLWK